MIIKKLTNLIRISPRITNSGPITRQSAYLLLILFFVTFSVKDAISQQSKDREALESELQVAMIFKILNFIQWPPQSFKSSDNKVFRIGVIGESPIFDAIKILEEERIKDLQVKVELVENIKNAKNFHLLYICPEEISNMPSILSSTKGAKTLTISKTPGFAKKGGMINFYENRGKMRFEINLDKAKSLGFKISSRVLSLAKIISSENQ